MTRRLRDKSLTTLALALLLFTAMTAPASAKPKDAAPEPGLTTVASGLDNPRGLAFAANGDLYVAEAGTGGAGPCFEGPEGDVCFGETGAITRIGKSGQARVITGLPSLAEAGGVAASGVHDVSLLGTGNAYAVIGLGGDPAVRDEFPELADMGTLIRFKHNKDSWTIAADMAAYETAYDPDGVGADSNPYAVLAVPGSRLVIDAGGNDLIEIAANGDMSTIATFPNGMAPAPPFLGLPPGTMIPYQAVPTSITQGPDGASYVGQLTGFPFPAGAAAVYRVVKGETPTMYAGGFTHIIDLAFAADGTMWVLQISQESLLNGNPTGALIEVRPDGTRHDHLFSGELIAPTGLAIGPDGALYISNFGIFPGEDPGGFFPGTGEVLRYVPAP